MTEPTRVVLTGVHGKMGRAITAALADAADLELVGSCTRGDDVAATLRQTTPDVLVDVTSPDCAADHARWAIDQDVCPIIGSSGLQPADVDEITAACQQKSLGGLWVPNFSIGAVLLQRLSEQAAEHLDAVEIIESHHPAKKDAPSGTALDTARRLARVRLPGSERLEDDGRGHREEGIPIHSVRLPGLIAEQTVRFGALGQTLSLTHVTYDRTAFMPGVLLSCRRVRAIGAFRVGLESLLFPSAVP